MFYAVLIAVASLAVGMVIASRLDLTPASGAQTVNVPAIEQRAAQRADRRHHLQEHRQGADPDRREHPAPRRGRARRELTEFFGGGDDIFERFFGAAPAAGPQQPRGSVHAETATGRSRRAPGTGFIIDKAGFILTNNHVVEGADVIRVSLFNGGLNEDYAAKVVGRDPLTDSALIQLTEMPAAPLQEVKFGDSSQLQQGDWVMAIGNPFSLGHTVTVGVISALGATVHDRRPRPRTARCCRPTRRSIPGTPAARC